MMVPVGAGVLLLRLLHDLVVHPTEPAGETRTEPPAAEAGSLMIALVAVVLLLVLLLIRVPVGFAIGIAGRRGPARSTAGSRR